MLITMSKGASLDFLLEYVFKTEGIAAEEYDVFLAHDIETEKKLENRKVLYNAIGAACERLGLKPFVPFRFLKSEEWGELSFRDTYSLLHEIMIPKTRIFLCDLTIPSQAIKELKNTAFRLEKPQIYFYEKGSIVSEGYANFIILDNNVKGILEYSTIRGCIKTLEAVIRPNLKD